MVSNLSCFMRLLNFLNFIFNKLSLEKYLSQKQLVTGMVVNTFNALCTFTKCLLVDNFSNY